MSEINIAVNAGSSVKLKTAGKYCDRDILVTAEGSAGGDNLAPFLEGSMTKLESNITFIRDYACYRYYAMTDVVLPEVITLGKYAFQECDALKNVYAPNVETINDSAFYLCTALETIDLPKCKTLGYYSFRSCSGLKTAKFPSVTLLESYVFRGCKALECLDFTGCTSVPICTTTLTLREVPETCQIIVPASLLDEWKAASYWSSIADQIVAAE